MQLAAQPRIVPDPGLPEPTRRGELVSISIRTVACNDFL